MIFVESRRPLRSQQNQPSQLFTEEDESGDCETNKNLFDILTILMLRPMMISNDLASINPHSQGGCLKVIKLEIK